MKVLFTCLGMSKGGAERVISTLANNMSNEGNEVTIITFINYKIEYELSNKIKLITIDRMSMKNLKGKMSKIMKLSPARLLRYRKEILKIKPDIIISFLPEPSLRLMFLKKFSKKIREIPTIISIRNDPNKEYKNKHLRNIVKKLYKNVDGMVFQTSDAKKYFEDLLNKKDNMYIIPNPINQEFIVDKIIKIRERDKSIVTVGRLEPQKNQMLLIDAFEKVYNKHSDYILKIYGEGSLSQKFKEYIKLKDLENSVILMGQVNNVKEEIEKSGIFVLSSSYEGMPNSLMEALALGIPCISTDCPCGGPKMLIEDSVNGYLTTINNANELENRINMLIENSEICEKISLNAYESMKKYYPDVILNSWRNCIDLMLKS